MDFHKLPKIELHAHLNGSLSNATLLALHKLKYPEDSGSLDASSYTIFSSQLQNLSNCFDKFKSAHDLTTTVEALRLATECVIKEFAAENTIYLELRSTPRATEAMSKSEYISTICQTIRDCSLTVSGILVKYLPSIDRAQGCTVAEENLDLILEARQLYPDLIRGIDISGNPVVDDLRNYKAILAEAKANDLKLAVHLGEVQDCGPEAIDILNMGIDRIGHGTFLCEDAVAWQSCVEQGILVECCLSSNVKCGTVTDLKDHHIQKMINHNVPVAICTDDYGVFQTSLTKEFETAAENYNLQKTDINRILIDSVNYSFAADAEKQTLLNTIANFFEL